MRGEGLREVGAWRETSGSDELRRRRQEQLEAHRTRILNAYIEGVLSREERDRRQLL